MNKTVIAAVVALTVTAGTLFTVSHAFADTASNQPYTSLVQKIADTFHLNKDDVQKVFDQNRQEREAKRQEKFTARLDQLVKDGKITEAQKQLLINKFNELETNRQSAMNDLKNKTMEERKAARQAEKQSLEDWAKQNGIDLSVIMPGMGHRMHW